MSSINLIGGYKKVLKAGQSGFTIIEIIIAVALTGIVSTIIYTVFITSFNQYFALHNDGLVYGDLNLQSQRIAQVLRSVTDISEATDTTITANAYFAPNDAVLSQVKYYRSADNKKLLADVTPYSTNPPAGTLQTTKTRTYTIVNDFYDVAGIKTFSYLGTGTAALTTPIADLHTIKQIKISLAAPTKAPSANGYDQITVQVFLRNRKTNL